MTVVAQAVTMIRREYNDSVVKCTTCFQCIQNIANLLIDHADIGIVVRTLSL